MKPQVRGRFHPWTDYELEAYLCDELEPDKRERLQAELPSHPALAEYLHGRSESARVFAREHPLAFEPLEPLPARNASVTSKRRGMLAAFFAAAAALAALWLVRLPAAPHAGDPQSAPSADRVRIKGKGLHAVLYVKRGDRVFEHVPDSPLVGGDHVRLAVDDPEGGYLTVLGLDARDELSVYYDAVSIEPGHTLTPDSLLLEDPQMDERWLVVVAREPRRASSIAERWRSAALGSDHYTELHVRTEPR